MTLQASPREKEPSGGHLLPLLPPCPHLTSQHLGLGSSSGCWQVRLRIHALHYRDYRSCPDDAPKCRYTRYTSPPLVFDGEGFPGRWRYLVKSKTRPFPYRVMKFTLIRARLQANGLVVGKPGDIRITGIFNVALLGNCMVKNLCIQNPEVPETSKLRKAFQLSTS